MYFLYCVDGVSFEAQGIFSNSPCFFKKSPGNNKLLLSHTLGLISFIEFYLDMLSYDIVEVKLKPFHLNCSWFSFFSKAPLTLELSFVCLSEKSLDKKCKTSATPNLKNLLIFCQIFINHQRTQCPALEFSKIWENKYLCSFNHLAVMICKICLD